MSTTTPEYLTTLRDGFADAVQQWMDQSTTAWDQWSQAWSPAVAAVGLRMPGAPDTSHGRHHGPGHRHGEADCGCGDSRHGCREPGHHHGPSPEHRGRGAGRTHAKECGCHDSCGCGDACDCCVPEADVVVRARAGEVRVVAFRLHNPWRREREVSIEVGPWHDCSGEGLQLRAVLEEKMLVLRPCEDRVVRLRVFLPGSEDDGSKDNGSDTRDDKAATGQGARAEAQGRTATSDQASRREPGDVVVGTGRRPRDVESCASAYADVRFEGCARPQRLAVVVLPADCDAVELGCDCGCCC